VFSGGFGAVGVEDLGLPAISGGSVVVVGRFCAFLERSRRSVVVSGGSVQAWSVSGVLWCYRRDWLSAIWGCW
jgi:hypothetical protein